MNWRAVGFCTPEFEQFRPGFEEMVTRLGGHVTVVRCASAGNWEDNTGKKPRCILDCLAFAAEEWVLYLDIDARLDAAPVVPASDEWDVGLVDNPVPHHRNRKTAAAIFIRNGCWGRLFLRLWAEECERQRGIDHPKMTRVWQGLERGGTVKFADATGWLRWAANGLNPHKETWEGPR